MATPFALEYHAPWLYGVAAITNLARVGSREHWFSRTMAGSLIGYGIGRIFWESARAPRRGEPRVLLNPSGVHLGFDAAGLWYEDRQPGLGAQFVAEIDHAVELASNHPDRFPLKHGEIRCIPARRFPYSVFFRSEADRIVVLAVFHAQRDPTIWERRE